MKKIFTAFLPFILVAQLPMNAAKFVPAEWMKRVQYGLKWTELMLDGYPGASEASETIPEGHVTTTVTMASAIPDPAEIEATADKYLCDVEYKEELAIQAREAIQAHMQAQRMRLQEIRVIRIVHM